MRSQALVSSSAAVSDTGLRVVKFADTVAFLRFWDSDATHLAFFWTIASVSVVLLLVLLSPVASVMVHGNDTKAQKIIADRLYSTMVALALSCSIFIVENLSTAVACFQAGGGRQEHEVEQRIRDEALCRVSEFDNRFIPSGKEVRAVIGMSIVTIFVMVSQLLGVYFNKVTTGKQQGLDIRYSQAYLHVMSGTEYTELACLALLALLALLVLLASSCSLALARTRLVASLCGLAHLAVAPALVYAYAFTHRRQTDDGSAREGPLLPAAPLPHLPGADHLPLVALRHHRRHRVVDPLQLASLPLLELLHLSGLLQCRSVKTSPTAKSR